MFIGKHGTGLITLSEFTKIVEMAFESDQLQYMTQSAALLDESIDFNRDVGQISVENSASNVLEGAMTDRNMRSAMQEDAAQLVARFTATYKDCEENNSMAQLTEMFDYIVTEN